MPATRSHAVEPRTMIRRAAGVGRFPRGQAARSAGASGMRLPPNGAPDGPCRGGLWLYFLPVRTMYGHFIVVVLLARSEPVTGSVKLPARLVSTPTAADGEDGPDVASVTVATSTPGRFLRDVGGGGNGLCRLCCAVPGDG